MQVDMRKLSKDPHAWCDLAPALGTTALNVKEN